MKYFLSVCFLAFILIRSEMHKQRKIQLPTQYIQGTINQKISISLTSQYFKEDTKIFAANTQNQEDNVYLNVNPAEVIMVEQNYMAIVPYKQLSLLEDLRTYTNSHFRHLLILQDQVFSRYIMIYEQPNIVIVYREQNSLSQKQLAIFQRFGLQGMTADKQTKIYEYNKRKNKGNQQNISSKLGGLLTVSNYPAFFRLHINSYRKLQLNQSVQIAYLQFMADQIIITAEYQKGVSIYEIKQNSGKADRIGLFTCSELGLAFHDNNKQGESVQNKDKECSITDLSYNSESKELYILDSYSGVHLYKIEQQLDSQTGLLANVYRLASSQSLTITKIRGCETMDFISQDHFILVCLDPQNFHSYLLEVVEIVNLMTGVKTFVKKDPMFHQYTFSDILATEDYYLAYDRSSINIFWNSIQTGLFMIQHTKSHLNFPGLQAFTLRQQKDRNQSILVMYGVQHGSLLKYRLQTKYGSVQLYSPTPVNKFITLRVPGPCPSVVEATYRQKKLLTQQTDQQNKQNVGEQQQYSHIHPIPSLSNEYSDESCVYYQPIKLEISNVGNRQHVLSMSLGIIIMMLIVLIILVCICYKKYYSMEVYTRKMLQRYRNKLQNKQNLQSIQI